MVLFWSNISVYLLKLFLVLTELSIILFFHLLPVWHFLFIKNNLSHLSDGSATEWKFLDSFHHFRSYNLIRTINFDCLRIKLLVLELQRKNRFSSVPPRILIYQLPVPINPFLAVPSSIWIPPLLLQYHLPILVVILHLWWCFVLSTFTFWIIFSKLLQVLVDLLYC